MSNNEAPERIRLPQESIATFRATYGMFEGVEYVLADKDYWWLEVKAGRERIAELEERVNQLENQRPCVRCWSLFESDDLIERDDITPQGEHITYEVCGGCDHE